MAVYFTGDDCNVSSWDCVRKILSYIFSYKIVTIIITMMKGPCLLLQELYVTIGYKNVSYISKYFRISVTAYTLWWSM